MYERDVYEDGVASISFIASKSKVAQLNEHSTPQIKLGLHLCQMMSKLLGGHVMKKSVSGVTA